VARSTDLLSYNNGITYQASSQLSWMDCAELCHLQKPLFLHRADNSLIIIQKGNKVNKTTALNTCIFQVMVLCITMQCRVVAGYQCFRESSWLHHEDGGSMVLQNVGTLHHYMASQPRWPHNLIHIYLFFNKTVATYVPLFTYNIRCMHRLYGSCTGVQTFCYTQSLCW
jgi:hypothetical protein